jgi:mannose-6-phosphate isomerase-like protein (cupin superfamily)
VSVDRVLVLSEEDGPELDIVEGSGSARAILWPGTGAQLRAMHRIRLDAGAATVALAHPGEAVYAVLAGDGKVSDDDAGTVEPLETGSMVHVDAGTTYRLVAGDGGLDLVGGPAPADHSLYPTQEA